MALDPITGIRIVYSLGITNVVALLLVFFSCRCMLGPMGNWLMQKEWYKKFYNFHCYYWLFLFASVITHAVVAFMIFSRI